MRNNKFLIINIKINNKNKKWNQLIIKILKK